ncbi:MAG: RNA polymerase sigma factor [Candidatus Omnitrophica bacterium]|nr:RNA polymerase sigma factor [Candidatus Omnitrophota bacterium]
MVDIYKDLVTMAQEGDIQAFEDLYRNSASFVYSVAFRITHNKADTEEVVQDVFMQIFKNLKDFKFKSSFKTWAYRIAINTAINKYNRSSKDKNRLQSFGEEPVIHSDIHKVPEFMEKEAREKEISSLLETLNPDQRTCLILREIEGLSYREIADALKINLNTVRTRLKRARQALMAGANRKELHYEL